MPTATAVNEYSCTMHVLSSRRARLDSSEPEWRFLRLPSGGYSAANALPLPFLHATLFGPRNVGYRVCPTSLTETEMHAESLDASWRGLGVSA